MRYFSEGVISGIYRSSQGVTTVKDSKNNIIQEAYVGGALRRLSGRELGGFIAALNILKDSQKEMLPFCEGYSMSPQQIGEKERAEVSAFNTVLRNHLETINRLGAFVSGMGIHQDDVAYGLNNWRDIFNRQYWDTPTKSDFEMVPGYGPIVKKGASPAEIEKENKEFEQNKQEGRAMEERMTREEIQEVEKKIAELKTLQEEVKKAEEIRYKEIRRDPTDYSLESGIKTGDHLLQDLKNILEGAGWFKKRRLSKEISALEEELTKQKGRMEEIKRQEKEKARAEAVLQKLGDPSFAIEKKVKKAEERLKILQEQVNLSAGK